MTLKQGLQKRQNLDVLQMTRPKYSRDMNNKAFLSLVTLLSSSTLWAADSVDTLTKYDPRYLRAEHRSGRVAGTFVDIIYEPPTTSYYGPAKVIVHTEALRLQGGAVEKAQNLQQIINEAKKQNPPTPLQLSFSSGSSASDKGKYVWLSPDPLAAKVAELEKELALYRANCTLPENVQSKKEPH